MIGGKRQELLITPVLKSKNNHPSLFTSSYWPTFIISLIFVCFLLYLKFFISAEYVLFNNNVCLQLFAIVNYFFRTYFYRPVFIVQPVVWICTKSCKKELTYFTRTYCITFLIIPHLCSDCVSAVESRNHEHSNEGHLQCDPQQPSGSLLFPPCGPWPFAGPQYCRTQHLHRHQHFLELFVGQSLELKGEWGKSSILRSSHFNSHSGES